MYKNVKGRILLTRRFFDFYQRIPILRGSEGVVEESFARKRWRLISKLRIFFVERDQMHENYLTTACKMNVVNL